MWIMQLHGKIFPIVNSKMNKEEDRYLGQGRRERKSESATIFFNFL